MTWTLSKADLDNPNLLINESLLSLGNGYIGVRGNFEEGYPEDYKSIRGTYINAFHDITEIKYGEKLYGFPEKQQKLVNVIDSQTIQIFIDGDRFSLFEGEILEFSRHLHMDAGYSNRSIHWKSPKGKEVKLHFKRMTSFVIKELFAIEVTVEPISQIESVIIRSTVNGDVSNFVDKGDPRVASGHAKLLRVTKASKIGNYSIVRNKTSESELEVACVTSTLLDASDFAYKCNVTDVSIEENYVYKGQAPIRFTKLNVYTDTLRHGNDVIGKGVTILESLKGQTYEDFLASQKEYLDKYWGNSDIRIMGDDSLQLGIRFNMYHLLQSAGKDSVSNIAAKGLSGEGYEGHYFWDTEIYMLPVFIMTNPKIAKSLLLHRYSLLDSARERAQQVGHKKGALFPWRTITGGESSAFFPAGTAQYHISADIAYSYIQYYLVTRDDAFLQDYMAEVLFETARLWIDTGHMLNGEFRIDDVTGPDEYTCIVNNNYYTNAMAKHNLLWAAKAYELLKENGSLQKVATKISLSKEEVAEWEEAGKKMHLPYDEILKINAQDDTFLKKGIWDLENTPKENFPLLLHYHPLTLYRYQVCKQADTVLAHFLLEDYESLETIKNSYEYYEKITTHDSSLSYCVFSIMAAKLGYKEKAYDYFIKTARLDLDNTHGNTKDGLHFANMGGTWLSIVYGFAGLRVKESGISFAPTLPEQWTSLQFKIQYQGNQINVMMEPGSVTYMLEEGAGITFKHYEEQLTLEKGKSITV
ncbi:glycosyl hydrolase family 65 protein [Bacillus sp. JJ1566]|uniref:glycoside hydrolase family 65 protein n=1 Tax=Bacillus sp. JJ1566 TaxID=3122961 RepID=UPI002FFE6FA3